MNLNSIQAATPRPSGRRRAAHMSLGAGMVAIALLATTACDNTPTPKATATAPSVAATASPASTASTPVVTATTATGTPTGTATATAAAPKATPAASATAAAAAPKATGVVPAPGATGNGGPTSAPSRIPGVALLVSTVVGLGVLVAAARRRVHV